MVTIKCDSCGHDFDYRPLRPLYSIDIQSTRLTGKNSSEVHSSDDVFETKNYCLCGKCLTKFYAYVANFFDGNASNVFNTNAASFFDTNMEDT